MKTKTILEAIEKEVERYTSEEYDEMLDEMQGEVVVCGITFNASSIMKEMDPTAYRCGFVNFQEYDIVYECPVCGYEHDDDDDAKYCCQEEEEEV